MMQRNPGTELLAVFRVEIILFVYIETQLLWCPQDRGDLNESPNSTLAWFWQSNDWEWGLSAEEVTGQMDGADRLALGK